MPEGRLRRILIVDDDALSREVTSMIAEAEGFDVAGQLGSSHELAERVVEIDVLLLDARLPGPPTRDVVTAVRDANPDISIHLLSGLSATELSSLAADVGADGWLVKSDVDALRTHLRRLGGGQ